MADDTISRQAALDALNASMIFGRCNEKTVTFKALKKYAEGVRERIEALPSAQPEITEDDVKEYCRKRCLIVVTSDFYEEMMKRWSQPERKKGRWIPMFNGTYYKCSECGYARMKGDDNFCKECGADMRG